MSICQKLIRTSEIYTYCYSLKSKIDKRSSRPDLTPNKLSSISSSNTSSDNDNGSGIKPLDDELMMCRRLLGIQCKERDEIQKENIFQTRCLVLGNVCSSIINRGSCINVASTRLVSKLIFMFLDASVLC